MVIIIVLRFGVFTFRFPLCGFYFAEYAVHVSGFDICIDDITVWIIHCDLCIIDCDFANLLSRFSCTYSNLFQQFCVFFLKLSDVAILIEISKALRLTYWFIRVVSYASPVRFCSFHLAGDCLWVFHCHVRVLATAYTKANTLSY